MRRAGLEGDGWWLALAGDGQLPALLDRRDALAGSVAELLQDHEGEQDQGDVADHGGVGEALAGAEGGVLFGVTEDGLHAPAALLACHHPGKVCLQGVGCWPGTRCGRDGFWSQPTAACRTWGRRR